MQTDIELNLSFSEASATRARESIISSLRSDAEIHVSDLNATPGATSPSADSMLNEAFRYAQEAAKSEGRRPKRSEVQAALYSLKSEAKQGFHI